MFMRLCWVVVSVHEVVLGSGECSSTCEGECS